MSSSTQLSRPELAVVMPVYNEAVNVASVVRDWFVCLEKLVPSFVISAINDGSKDETESVLTALGSELGPRLRIVNKRNSGHGRSCREGYELALNQGAAWILQIDSDGQCDPEFFPEFYREREAHDCLFGQRTSRGDGLGRILISKCCSLLVSVVTGILVKDPNVPYRLMRATALRGALRRIPADVDLQNIALSVVLKRNSALRWKYFPIHFRARRGGENSINYRKIAKMGARFLRDFYRINHEDSHTWRRPRGTRRRLAS